MALELLLRTRILAFVENGDKERVTRAWVKPAVYVDQPGEALGARDVSAIGKVLEAGVSVLLECCGNRCPICLPFESDYIVQGVGIVVGVVAEMGGQEGGWGYEMVVQRRYG